MIISQVSYRTNGPLVKTFGMQNGEMVIFFLRSFRKVRFLKNAVSGRW